MENTTKTSTIKDEVSIVSEAQIANGELLLVDPSGKEYPITDYTKDLSSERERAILDKIVLLQMAASLRHAHVEDIIKTFIEVLSTMLKSVGNGKNDMDNYINTLETELAFHKFIKDVANEKKDPVGSIGNIDLGS